jgi:hypothetical protein
MFRKREFCVATRVTPNSVALATALPDTTKFGGKNARRSVSRVLSPPRTTGDDHSSGTTVTGRLARPTRAISVETRLPRETRDAPPLFGLAPGGVYHAADVTAGAVRSYRTLSPLPAGPGKTGVRTGGLLSVALSLGSPPPGVTRHRVSMEPGLSSPRQAGRRSSDRLAGARGTPGRRKRQARASTWKIRWAVSGSTTPSTRRWRK